MDAPQTVTNWALPVRATVARLHLHLDPNLILAMIWQESTGQPWAWNPEPRYRWLVNVKTGQPFRPLSPAELASETPPADFPCLAGDPDQEWWGQQASWGLLQVMGAAAREQGFKGAYLPELCDPYVNLEFGIWHFWNYALQYGNREMREGLQRYNGGGNLRYAAEVLAKMETIQNGPLV